MKTAVVVPNWNGADFLADCIESLLVQTHDSQIVIVDNGSTDESGPILDSYRDAIVRIQHEENRGFSGGVNAGIRWALDRGYEAIALLNNDAVAEPDWLGALAAAMNQPGIGMSTSLILLGDGERVDTSGDRLSTWGLAEPRWRGRLLAELPLEDDEFVFGACGGATLYRASMLREIGLFDEDFFAYYEDVDLSFRAQLAGWKVVFTPRARVRHRLGATSSRVSGFATYQTYKNMPLVLHKNLPRGLRLAIYPRFYLAYASFQVYTLFTSEAGAMLRGSVRSLLLTPRKLRERRAIVRRQVVTNDYIRSLLTTELPEGYVRLRQLRAMAHAVRRGIGRSRR